MVKIAPSLLSADFACLKDEIDKITSIDFDISIFDTYCRESEQLKRL